MDHLEELVIKGLIQPYSVFLCVVVSDHCENSVDLIFFFVYLLHQ